MHEEGNKDNAERPKLLLKQINKLLLRMTETDSGASKEGTSSFG